MTGYDPPARISSESGRSGEAGGVAAAVLGLAALVLAGLLLLALAASGWFRLPSVNVDE